MVQTETDAHKKAVSEDNKEYRRLKNLAIDCFPIFYSFFEEIENDVPIEKRQLVIDKIMKILHGESKDIQNIIDYQIKRDLWRKKHPEKNEL